MLEFHVEIFFQIGEEGRVVGEESCLDAVEPNEKTFCFFLEDISKDIPIPNYDFISEVLKSKSGILRVWVPRVLDDFRERKIAKPDGF